MTYGLFPDQHKMFRYRFFKAIKASGALGPGGSLRLAKGTGDLFFLLDRARRWNVCRNLGVVTGSTDPRRIRRGAREVFRNFWKYLYEFLGLTGYYLDNLESRIDFAGRENLDRALDGGHGVILLTAHVGNWELAGVAIAAFGYPMNAVYMPFPDKRIDRLFNGIRTVSGQKAIPFAEATRGCLDALGRGEALALMGDLVLEGRSGTAEYFGRPARFPKGPAVLSMRTGAPVLPAFLLRRSDGGFRFSFGPPLKPDSHPAGKKDTEGIFQAGVRAIEEKVREHPHQWLVFQDFWEGA